MLLTHLILLALLVYVAVGLIVAVGFALHGLKRVDPVARDASVGFRIVILPGCCVLWPLIACWWIRGRSAA